MRRALSLLLPLAVLSVSNAVKVGPSNCFQQTLPNCVSLDHALENISSDTTLYLIPGEVHVLEHFALVRNLSNITLVGTGQRDVVITCQEGVGLAFVDIVNLTIANITIRECGLSGRDLDNANAAVNESVHAFYRIPHSVQIALFLGNCQNVTLQSMTVTNTTGLGLVGINIHGTSSFTGVTFSYNRFPLCIINQHAIDVVGELYPQLIGGGAFLIYYDTKNNCRLPVQLTVDNSTFLENRDCSISGTYAKKLSLAYGSSTLQNLGYNIGGGGGLSVVLTQADYAVSITTISTLFHNNIGMYGAGAHIAIFLNTHDVHVVFSNCTFIGGGNKAELSDDLLNFSGNGGGFAVLTGLVRLDSLNSDITNVIIEVVNCVFVNNTGFQGGGVYYTSVHSQASHNYNDLARVQILHKSCVFEANSAVYGAAIYAEGRNLVPETSYVLVQVLNITARNNQIVSGDLSSIQGLLRSTGIIDIRFINFTLSGSTSVAQNKGTGLYAYRSLVHIENRVTFDHNVGGFGGAFCLVAYSYIIVHNDTSLEIQNNHASVAGGAFYVNFDTNPTNADYDCFLYLNSVTQSAYCYSGSACSNFNNSKISLIVTGNTAPVGSMVYGSTLDCFWVDSLNKSRPDFTSPNRWEFLRNNANSTFIFDRAAVGREQISTLPIKLTVDDQAHYITMPGQAFNVNLNAMDKFSYTVPTAISSTVVQSSASNSSSTVGSSNFVGLHGSTTPILLNIAGKEGQEVEVSVFTVDSFVSVSLLVSLTHCNLGYTYDDDTSSCTCIPELHDAGIHCSVDHLKLIVPNHVWIGPVDILHGGEDVAIANCVFDYCKPGEKVVQPGEFDSQCAEGYNRIGLLCGSCAKNYSAVLGTRRCQRCTNNAFLALIVAFAAAGILLVVTIAFLKVSVSDGYLYGVLFYSQIVTPYITRLAPRTSAIFFPVALLNLSLGIETCFYNGMNALARAGLQLVFPFYIYSLMGITVLLARCFKCPNGITLKISFGKTFATLLVLSYTSILQTSIEILGSVNIDGIMSKHSSTRWIVDPSVHYFQGVHAFLASIAILLVVVYIIPFPLLLLFPSKVYQWKYVRMLKPIYDALWNSFKPKFRWWLGVRLLTLVLPAVFSSYLWSPPNVFATTLFLIALLYVQSQIQPYQGVCRNVVDGYLLMNMTVLFAGLLFFDHFAGISGNTHKITNYHSIFTSVVLATIYVLFLGVLFYHVYLRLPQHVQAKFQERLKRYAITKKLLGVLQCTQNTETTERKYSLNTYNLFEREDTREFETTYSILEHPTGTGGIADLHNIDLDS